MSEQAVRYWSIDQDEDGWSFSYLCYESQEAYVTKEEAMAGLLDLLARDNQRLLAQMDDED